MTIFVFLSLIFSGIIVGFINTLAGGGTIISVSLFMFLGLPAPIANGTNRIAVLFQNIVAVRNFIKSGSIDIKKGLLLSIPTIIGAILGAKIAVQINERVLEIAIIFSMLLVVAFLLFNPKKFIQEDTKITKQAIKPLTYFLFFLVGVYGGFIHIGVGYLFLLVLVLFNGYDLVKSNAMKNFLVLMYVPFSLVVFITQNQVNWEFGLIHSIGNIIGAYFASKYAYKLGSSFIRYLIIFLIFLSIMEVSGIIKLRTLFETLIN